jgi:hypothetical protein
MDNETPQFQDYGDIDTIKTRVGSIVAITTDGSGNAAVTFPEGWEAVAVPQDGRLSGQEDGTYTLAAARATVQPGTYEITVADDEEPENPYTIEVEVAAAK